MKFLCGNCRAKYQIADEKIAGRTLRMKCRRCNHDIVIRGDDNLLSSSNRAAVRPGSAPGRPPAPPAPGSRRPGPRPPVAPPGPAPRGPGPQAASRKPPGSALGADFRQKAAAGQSGDSRAAVVEPLWHVAINDVPVGPIRRDEITRKVAAGAVTGESLCWREGFDDWRPMKDVAELAAVLKTKRSTVPPQPIGGRPATGRTGRGSTTGSRSPTGRTTTSGSTSRRSAASAPSSTSGARATARSNVVPIGGRLGGGAAPAFDDLSDEDDEMLSAEPTRVAGFGLPGEKEPFSEPPSDAAIEAGLPAPLPESVPPGPETPAEPGIDESQPLPTDIPIPPRRGLPVGAWIAIASAGAFGSVLAVMIGLRFLNPPQPEIRYIERPGSDEATQEPTTVAAPEAPLAPTADASAEEPTVVAEATPGQRTKVRTPRNPGSQTTKQQTPDNLTPEQRAMLERMRGQGATIAGPGSGPAVGGSDGPRGEGLNAQQLSAVVGRNRPQLQRCYEQAIRGMGDPPTIRLDVAITVGSSGAVTRVDASGQDPVNLGSCVERAVRGWSFPSSGDSTQTRFPVVFQAAGG